MGSMTLFHQGRIASAMQPGRWELATVNGAAMLLLRGEKGNSLTSLRAAEKEGGRFSLSDPGGKVTYARP